MFKLIFFSLFSHLAIGSLLPLFFIALEEIGTLYFRLVSLLAALFLGFALLAQPFSAAQPAVMSVAGLSTGWVLGLLAASLVILLAGALWIQTLRKRYLWPAFGAGVLALLAGAFFFPAAAGAAQPALPLKALSVAGSAFLLGSVMTAMITGHWYLVNHRLTMQPLRIASLLFLAAVILRTLFVTGVMSFHALAEETTAAALTRHLLGLSGEGLIFWARVAIGLVGPLIFGFMVQATVKLRSTQSATGILYAAVVMVFIGEAFSKFIWFFTGIPV
ncbi:MAG: hypothetical protein ONB48_16940 [candidate division KSB1 bacterium]|nr:hypothetical protein [candidate division KSB1 bacterium]MDZ7275164.1 hypothetical protein [candidate division KSB1 bacterium]MDZ7287333.1 hypothetical protein [candidate division KSB1 bacterium]MDZ7299447.1 hypothetical protein [candidate division KSB1 bacterium]MDZ7305507.1 hypothetical protein [candidate division KSB1 bacterium]